MIFPGYINSWIPGFVNSDAIKHFIRQRLGGWNSLIASYALKVDYWLIAKNLFEQRKKEIELGSASDYTAVEFAQALGSNTIHTSSAIKFLKRKLDTDMNWLEIKSFLLTKKLP